MKAKGLLLIALVLLVFTVLPVSADGLRKNPSIHSLAEIEHQFSEMWDAYPDEILKMMENFPDFECRRSYDIIRCSSVNNKYSADVHVNFQFLSEKDTAGFVRAVCSMEIESAEEIQEIIESFWLPDMSIANLSGGYYPEEQIWLYFSTEDTLMTCMIPVSEPGKYWYITVDFGVIRG